MRVNYERESYCKHCDIKLPKETIRHKECGFPVRHHTHGNKNGNQWYKRYKDSIPKVGKGYRFVDEIDMKRLKRMRQGLNPNIPVEDI